MSSYTENLNLFKYNTTDDAALPFNITEALNNNWDKLDTFAKNLNTTISGKQDKLGYTAANINAGNFNSAGKIIIAGLGMPSNKYVSLTLGATEATYIAPANGYFVLNVFWSLPASWIAVGNGNVIGYSQTGTGGASNGITYCPAKKGQSVYVNYYSITPVWFGFVYTDGDNV